MERVMVDVETLGTEPGCAILSIGAARFDEDGVSDTYAGTFYETVDLESCIAEGLTMEPGTVAWWLDQPDDVSVGLGQGDSLVRVLHRFAEWYGDADEVWAFSPSFDCAVLEAAYDAIAVESFSAPWSYRDERCARTVAALPNAVEVEREGDVHDALDDARYQARMVSRTLARMQEVSADAD